MVISLLHKFKDFIPSKHKYVINKTNSNLQLKSSTVVGVNCVEMFHF